MRMIFRECSCKNGGAAGYAEYFTPVLSENQASEISLLTGADLITSGLLLAQKGRKAAAKICLISGCLVLAFEIIRFFAFRRK